MTYKRGSLARDDWIESEEATYLSLLGHSHGVHASRPHGDNLLACELSSN